MSRYDIEKVGEHPGKLASEIHRQLGQWDSGAIPVKDIAFALDVFEIREEPLDNCEGSLLMPPNKSKGSILVNARSSFMRKRFTIAHELCHLIHVAHKPMDESGGANGGMFQCGKQDMTTRDSSGRIGLTAYQKQELQANQFAAELLMPRYKLRANLREQPNLEHVLSIASDLKVSKETAAQRYVALHDENIAIVFSEGGSVRYWAKRESFPRVKVWNGGKLDEFSKPIGNTRLTHIDEANIEDWLTILKAGSLKVQTLFQSRDYAMTLLNLEEKDEEEDEELLGSYERFPRF